MTATIWTAAGVIFVYVNLVHLVARLKKDNGIMDAAWGMGFVLVALFTFYPWRTASTPAESFSEYSYWCGACDSRFTS